MQELSQDRRPKTMSRREALGRIAVTTGVILTPAFLLGGDSQRHEHDLMAKYLEHFNWPTEPEAILNKIKELEFTPGSQLSTTLFPRKIFYEMMLAKHQLGEWPGGEELWFKHLEIFEEALQILKDAGIKSARLEVVPFELSKDGKEFDWQPLELAIEMMKMYDIAVELCIGPLDYPYHPGIRLPIKLEDTLRAEINSKGENEIRISMDQDGNFPNSSAEIRDFGLLFTQEIMKRFGNHPDIRRFYIGNEWPNEHGVEGSGLGHVTMKVEKDFMLEVVRIVKAATDKKIAINTNIHPSEPQILEKDLGELINILGEQGIVGFDTYSTREAESPELFPTMFQYEEMMKQIRAMYPKTEMVFTEFQAETWPPDELAGRAWAEIYQNHPDLVTQFYQNFFPPTLESHVIASGIKDVNLWGAPLIIVCSMLGYDFPKRMMSTIAEQMQKNP